MKSTKFGYLLCALASLTLAASLTRTSGQGTAFTYQGRLASGTSVATGGYDLKFSLYDALVSGTLIAGPQTNSATGVTNGLFTTLLDFGAAAFTGPDRWLEIGVRTNGAGAFSTLAPRQKVAPAPYAILAGGINGILSANQLGGTYTGVLNFNNAADSYTGNGAGLTGVNAAQLGGLSLGAFALLNSSPVFTGSVTAGGDLLGARLNVGSGHTLTGSFSSIAGGQGNYVGSPYAIIAGGQSNFVDITSLGHDSTLSVIGGGAGNQVNSPYATIGGGLSNSITGSQPPSKFSVVGGGLGNVIDTGWEATIGGGVSNSIVYALGGGTTISGGTGNQNAGSAATIGGGDGNLITGPGSGGSDSPYATIGGGRSNRITFYVGRGSSISGGVSNQISSFGNNYYPDGYSAIGGGLNNSINNVYGVIGGGRMNAITNSFATIAGGVGNLAGGVGSFIGGGGTDGISTNGNQASGLASTIAGGLGNSNGGNYATIAGGSGNSVPVYAFFTSGDYAAIGGGDNNYVGGRYATIPGGLANRIINNSPGGVDYTSIGGGIGNAIDGSPGSTIGGGLSNFVGVCIQAATISGGNNNTNHGDAGTIGGGRGNFISGANCGGGPDVTWATISGGGGNFVGGFCSASTIAGGVANQITNNGNGFPDGYSAIGGGRSNIVNGIYAAVPGGQNNLATNYAFAAGRRAKAYNQGSFVWADSTDADFHSSVPDSVSFRCAGGAGFYSGVSGANQQVTWAPGGGSWTFSSDRNLKDRFQPVDAREVLEKVTRLPIQEWSYKEYPERHIGAMAQDFHALFPLNENDKMLNDADLHGVALAAIKGLNEKLIEELNRRDAENAELKLRLESLEKLVRNQKPN
jgi:hypothetical protein